MVEEYNPGSRYPACWVDVDIESCNGSVAGLHMCEGR